MSLVTRTAAALLIVLAAGTACGTKPDPAAPPPAQNPPADQTVPAVRPDLEFGQTGSVIGENGTKLTMTPYAIMYTKDAKESTAPANGWYVVIAIRGEATGGIDRVAPPISGNGFYWRGEEVTLDPSEGNASNTSWTGTVNEFGSPMEPGHPEAVLETFDVPAKGGRLIYINADGTITAWRLPSSDSGDQKVFERVRARMTEFGGERP
ncbi:hypothetical protein [Nonomuraea africana]|uniref:Uncharacterized protein n=1 Tax=Nonomuraea africana TaxID=46171 RepID=A0ABR9KRK7_9ACTN|nr:hypothetical protein [Nonomuraea africana]MBE1564662.1 hypothetical protein [Nonomuraea africana]